MSEKESKSKKSFMARLPSFRKKKDKSSPKHSTSSSESSPKKDKSKRSSDGGDDESSTSTNVSRQSSMEGLGGRTRSTSDIIAGYEKRLSLLKEESDKATVKQKRSSNSSLNTSKSSLNATFTSNGGDAVKRNSSPGDISKKLSPDAPSKPSNSDHTKPLGMPKPYHSIFTDGQAGKSVLGGTLDTQNTNQSLTPFPDDKAKKVKVTSSSTPEMKRAAPQESLDLKIKENPNKTFTKNSNMYSSPSKVQSSARVFINTSTPMLRSQSANPQEKLSASPIPTTSPWVKKTASSSGRDVMLSQEDERKRFISKNEVTTNYSSKTVTMNKSAQETEVRRNETLAITDLDTLKVDSKSEKTQSSVDSISKPVTNNSHVVQRKGTTKEITKTGEKEYDPKGMQAGSDADTGKQSVLNKTFQMGTSAPASKQNLHLGSVDAIVLSNPCVKNDQTFDFSSTSEISTSEVAQRLLKHHRGSLESSELDSLASDDLMCDSRFGEDSLLTEGPSQEDSVFSNGGYSRTVILSSASSLSGAVPPSASIKPQPRTSESSEDGLAITNRMPHLTNGGVRLTPKHQLHSDNMVLIDTITYNHMVKDLASMKLMILKLSTLLHEERVVKTRDAESQSEYHEVENHPTQTESMPSQSADRLVSASVQCHIHPSKSSKSSQCDLLKGKEPARSGKASAASSTSSSSASGSKSKIAQPDAKQSQRSTGRMSTPSSVGRETTSASAETPCKVDNMQTPTGTVPTHATSLEVNTNVSEAAGAGKCLDSLKLKQNGTTEAEDHAKSGPEGGNKEGGESIKGKDGIVDSKGALDAIDLSKEFQMEEENGIKGTRNDNSVDRKMGVDGDGVTEATTRTIQERAEDENADENVVKVVRSLKVPSSKLARPGLKKPVSYSYKDNQISVSEELSEGLASTESKQQHLRSSSDFKLSTTSSSQAKVPGEGGIPEQLKATDETRGRKISERSDKLERSQPIMPNDTNILDSEKQLEQEELSNDVKLSSGDKSAPEGPKQQMKRNPGGFGFNSANKGNLPVRPSQLAQPKKRPKNTQESQTVIPTKSQSVLSGKKQIYDLKGGPQQLEHPPNEDSNKIIDTGDSLNENIPPQSKLQKPTSKLSSPKTKLAEPKTKYSGSKLTTSVSIGQQKKVQSNTFELSPKHSSYDQSTTREGKRPRGLQTPKSYKIETINTEVKRSEHKRSSLPDAKFDNNEIEVFKNSKITKSKSSSRIPAAGTGIPKYQRK